VRPPDFLLDQIGNAYRTALLPGGLGLSSSEGVRHRILALLDIGQQCLVDRRIERRRFILVEPGAAKRIGALLNALLPFDFPLLEELLSARAER
jgi:hypothetical protein